MEERREPIVDLPFGLWHENASGLEKYKQRDISIRMQQGIAKELAQAPWNCVSSNALTCWITMIIFSAGDGSIVSNKGSDPVNKGIMF